jgi:hypothetical protein
MRQMRRVSRPPHRNRAADKPTDVPPETFAAILGQDAVQLPLLDEWDFSVEAEAPDVRKRREEAGLGLAHDFIVAAAGEESG